HARHDRPVALDEALRSMVLHLLAHIERRERPPMLEAYQRDRAGEGAAAELDAGDRLAARKGVERAEHELAGEGVTLRREHGLVAVDEEGALPTGGEDDALLLERPLPQELDQALSWRCHRAPFRRSWAFWPLRSAGTTGGGGPPGPSGSLRLVPS